ncbi:unnamed protein product [Porites evermanni]|uniref:Uncharacterized protein n=1 Tax=Porites evermanni TaxID=104178 RepID=A0ABN8PIM5_9CNID|nr:unnamed protein product [Porites evermanni]
MADELGEIAEIATGSETKVSKRKLKRLQVEAASKLRCSVCVNKRFTSLKMYDDHMASKNHRKKELRKNTSGVWVCQACDLTLNSQTEWVRHLCGRRHHEKLTQWSLELFPTSSPIRQREIDLLDDSKYQEFEEDNEDGMVE